MILKNKENYQYTIYTDKSHKPDKAFSISPRGKVEVTLTADERQYVTSNYPVRILGGA